MANDDVFEAIGGILLGVIGGIALAEILDKLTSKPCPVCGSRVSNHLNTCNKCGYRLK